MDFQIHIVKIIQLGGQSKNTLGERNADIERLRVGVLVELANVVGAGAGLIDLDFDELGVTGLENFAKGDFGSGIIGGLGGSLRDENSEHRKQKRHGRVRS